MKNRREAGLEIDDAVAAQILSLLISHALQRFFRLHHGDGMSKTFQIFGKASLIRASKKPLRQFVRIIGRKALIALFFRQLDDCPWTQDTVEMFVQKNLG